MENIKINKAILHILDNNHEAPVLSARELEIDKDVSDFLAKHISKVLVDGDLKKAWFNPDGNEISNLCSRLSQDEALFVNVSCELAGRLFVIMRQNPAIPSADVIFCLFDTLEARYLALLKLNYRSSYIHYVSNTDEGSVNRLVRQKTTLPGEGQKVDEAVLVNLADIELEVLEKQYEICDKKEPYLSKYFLKCRSELSCAQKIKVLDKAVSKISRKHLDKDFDKVTKLRSCLAESMEETNEIKVDQVAERVFGGNTAFKEEYLAEIKKAGLVENTVVIPEHNNTGKKFRTQRLKTDSGIEINFPSHFYGDKDVMEFINNPDGTISILIKNVGKVVNK